MTTAGMPTPQRLARFAGTAAKRAISLETARSLRRSSLSRAEVVEGDRVGEVTAEEEETEGVAVVVAEAQLVMEVEPGS